MLRFILLFLSVFLGLLSASSQPLSMTDLRGAWYFHQYFVDSSLFADADITPPFPTDEYKMMKQAVAAIPNAQVPDSASFASTLKQVHENYRRYRIDFKEDSTYVTELSAGMSKWVPEKGQLRRTHLGDGLQMLDASGTSITTAIEMKDGELYLSMNGLMSSLLVFRREQPE